MQRGQATLEYVGVVALVAVVLALAAALTPAPDLAAAVGAQIRRALCLVAGGDCLARGGPRACVVGTLDRRRDARGELLLVRLADGRAVLREERSDGTVAVTVAQSSGAGAGIVLGTGLQVGGRTARVGLGADALATAAYVRGWTLPDGPAADRLIRALAEDDVPFGGVGVELARLATGGAHRGPVPETRRYVLGGEVSGTAALRALGLGAEAELLGAGAIAAGGDDRTGEREVVVRVSGDATARLTAPLAGLGFGLPHETTATVTFDRDGRPVRLALAHTRAVHGEVRAGDLRSQGGDRLEAEVRLELTDPAAQADALAALRGQPAPAARTARRLAEEGRVDVRAYATERSASSRGFGGALLGGLGAEVVRSTERARLVFAAAREPGLGWSRNLDCELAARASRAR